MSLHPNSRRLALRETPIGALCMLLSGAAAAQVSSRPGRATARRGCTAAGARVPFLDDFAKDVMPYVERNYRQ
jgi:hypothetical protein